jgi:DNA polymerase-1
MLLQIHDELVFETPTATAEATRTLVTQRMEQAMTLSVPIKVDASVSSNWFDG